MAKIRGTAVGVLTAVLIALPLLGQMPAVAQPAEPETTGGIGIRLLEAPVELQNDPRAMTYIVDNLPPGTAITRRIEVSNSSNIDRQISVYPAAATIDPAGGFQVGDDRAANELTTWMSVAPTEVTLPPGGTSEAVVSINVPPDAPEGEQYAVVWAQTAGENTGGGIQSVSRVGIRTYLSVGPGNGPAADFTIDEVTAGRSSAGAPEVVAKLTNTGGRALDPSGTVTLSGGPGGTSTAPVVGSGGSVIPGGTGEVRFELDPALSNGPWQATVSVTSGLLNKTSDVSVTFPDEGSVTATANESDDGVPVWVWIAIALAIVVVGAGILFTVRRRKTD